jgi:hypothetical protein
MDDRFMYGLREAPRRRFAESLRERLERQEIAGATNLDSGPRTLRYAMIAAGVAIVVLLFVLPSIRASAQAFLNLFRVVNFAAVPVNVERINELTKSGLDIPGLIGQQVEIVADPGPGRAFVTPDDAAKAAGIQVKLPTVLPPGLVIVRTEMQGEHVAHVTGDTHKLSDVLDALGITDLRPPAGLDGQVATVRVPPIVRIVYAYGNQEVAFLQAKSPEVTLPASIDLPALGEIGLRIVGLDRGQAHTLAQAIDWRGTLVVPVPAGVSSFRQVEVHGSRGLLVESTKRHDIRAVVWSERGSVYGITGPLKDQAMLQMAESVQ